MAKKIAITGGIGSGKSYVAAYIKTLGYPVFSCDEIYKELCNSAVYVEKVQALFPEVVSNNQINRKKLAEIVFSDETQLEKLNRLSHPLIMQNLFQKMDNAKGNLIFAEVPLLFEGGFEKDFCETIYVKRNLTDRIRGVIQRDKIGENEAMARIRNQIDFSQVECKIKENNLIIHVIENEGTLMDLEEEINQLIQSLNT